MTNGFVQGGPGCSSFDGLMLETGPFRVDENGGIKTVDGGWEEYTNMVFGMLHWYDFRRRLTIGLYGTLVDQPAGTGYSYTSTDRFVHELSDVSNDYVFIVYSLLTSSTVGGGPSRPIYAQLLCDFP